MKRGRVRTGAMIGITTDGIVCGRLGRRLSEAERWDQTGWQNLTGVPWDLRSTGMLVPEVDVEAQPGAAEAERRERRWQRPRKRAESFRPRDEAHRAGVQEESAAKVHSALRVSLTGCEFEKKPAQEEQFRVQELRQV